MNVKEDSEMEKRQQKRTRIVGVRLTAAEFEKIEKKLRKTTAKGISEYLRYLLLDKPVVSTFRNQSTDDLIGELALLRTELNRIGVNFNQSVKKLHTLHETSDFKRWLLAHELEKRTLANKIEEIKNHILKIVQSWLR